MVMQRVWEPTGRREQGDKAKQAGKDERGHDRTESRGQAGQGRRARPRSKQCRVQLGWLRSAGGRAEQGVRGLGSQTGRRLAAPTHAAFM